MGTQITFRRGSSFPTAGSGITLAEPVFETTLHTFHIGLGHGVTAEWVGAPISGLSADIAAGITYKTPTLKAVKDYVTDYVTAVNGVLTVNGFAGGVTLNAGTALGLTSSSGNITLTNLGIQSFNGLTGAVGGVTTSVANTFVPMQSFSAGISAAGGTFSALTQFTAGISSAGGTFTQETRFASGLSASVVKTLNLSGYGGLSPSFIDGQFRLSQLMGTFTTVLSSGSTDRSITLPDADGTVALTSQLMGAVNGSTAATTAVTSFNGNTGAVQGVSSVNGSTGAITNVARTNVDNNFTEYQTIKSFGSGVPVLLLRDPSGYTMSFVPDTSFGTPNISVDSGSASQILQFSATATTNTVTLPNFTTTIAGLTGTQTFTGLKTFTGGLCASAGITFNGTVSGATATFSRLTTHTAGLCAAGITVSGNIRFSGTSAKTISSNQATLTIAGISTSPILVGENSVVMGVQVTDSLTLNSATSIVDISTTTSGVYPSIPSIRILTDDGDIIGAGSIKIIPASYATANRTQYLQDANGTLALTSQLMGAVNGSTAATTAVTSFNGLTGAVTGVTVGGVNTFTQINTFSAGISAAGSTFASTTNTLDVIASTEGAGLRIARATSGVGSRIGGIRLGRSTTSNLNTYIEGSSGTFSLYNGVDTTGTLFAAFSTTQFSLGTTSASFITLNCPNNISFGDQGSVGNNQLFSISGTNRTYTFGDSNGVTTGFVGINRSGLCGDYALEVNSPTGKGVQLIYNDHTGAASNWVNMDVSSGGNFTVHPSGGLATVTGTLNVSAGLCAAGGVTFSGTIASDTGYRITSNAINAQTGTTYTFLSSDNGKVVTFNNGSTTTVTIPTGLPVGFNCTAIQLGAGQVGFTAASGVTMNAYASAYKISGQHGAAALISYTTNIFNLSGTLSA